MDRITTCKSQQNWQEININKVLLNGLKLNSDLYSQKLIRLNQEIDQERPEFTNPEQQYQIYVCDKY